VTIGDTHCSVVAMSMWRYGCKVVATFGDTSMQHGRHVYVALRLPGGRRRDGGRGHVQLDMLLHVLPQQVLLRERLLTQLTLERLLPRVDL